jgi:hypothetical protein
VAGVEYRRYAPIRIDATKNAITTGVRFITRRRRKNGFLGGRLTDLTMDRLSLPELKQVARSRHIKQYYILKRAELIHLLNLPELPASYRIEKMTIHELRDEAKKRNIRGFWNLRRDRLVALLFPEHAEHVKNTAPHKHEEDERETEEHHDPEEHDPKEVGVQKV